MDKAENQAALENKTSKPKEAGSNLKLNSRAGIRLRAAANNHNTWELILFITKAHNKGQIS